MARSRCNRDRAILFGNSGDDGNVVSAEKVTPMSLETPEELVELAMDARRLARVICDAKAIDELRRLATQYEKKAVEIRSRNLRS